MGELMYTFWGWERGWGQRIPSVVFEMEAEAFGRGMKASLYPTRWGIGLSRHGGAYLIMWIATIGPTQIGIHWQNNAPEAVAYRKSRLRRTTANVLRLLQERKDSPHA